MNAYEEYKAAVASITPEESARVAALFERMGERAKERKEDQKDLDHLRVKYDHLLDKRERMLFCAGATDPSASEYARGLARSRLERTKAWRGNEYDIMLTKRNIEYLERED